MYINRLSQSMAAEGRTIVIGEATIFLWRDSERGSAIVIGIDAPAHVPIRVEKGVPDEKPQKRLPIPPST